MRATTRASRRRRRRPRFSTMEILGFFEDTVTNSTIVPTLQHQPAAVSSPKPGPVDPLGDWQPNEVGRQLVAGRVRWGQVLGVIMMCAGLAGIAAWLYIRPAELAAAAMTEIQVKAETLESSLLSLGTVNDDLTTDAFDSQEATLAMLEVEARARELFETSGRLVAEQTAARAAASDGAGDAISASRILADTVAYRDALVPMLTPPTLQTDPQLIELDAAAFEFGEWELRFEQLRDALPAGVMTDVSQTVHEVSGELDTIRSRYLDALQVDDAAAAEAAISDLNDRLGDIELALALGLAESQERVSDRIAEALASLTSLLG